MDRLQVLSRVRSHARTATIRGLSRRGFTLVEMLITLAIAGILLAIGVPAMTSFLAMRSSVANAEELVEALRFARSEALKRSSQVSVCSTTEPDAANPTCGGAGDWMSGWVVSAGGRVLRVQNVVRAMKQINTSEATVTFEATGIASSGAATFEFVPIGEVVDDRVRTVDLNVQGRVRLLKGRAPA